ncbi:MAG: Flp family type IVb pilin [Erythrobacter sp.]|jgi:pilus assembly protein Flp/PilA|nr:Flp family type IVb pilin [Erythrobacter sp.]RZV31596.1 MAG: Flp family type IVb pilin [Sphingomonadaceae bacterium]
MRNLIKRLRDDVSGATAVEYGLILAMVFLGMVAAVQGVGNETIGLWNTISSASEAAMNRGSV